VKKSNVVAINSGSFFIGNNFQICQECLDEYSDAKVVFKGKKLHLCKKCLGSYMKNTESAPFITIASCDWCSAASFPTGAAWVCPHHKREYDDAVKKGQERSAMRFPN
jgi:hypothetical protein